VPKQGEIAWRDAWPEDAVFRRLVLDVECDSCEHCGATLHVCDHRIHRVHTLQGPVEFPVAWLAAPTAFSRFAANPQNRWAVLGTGHAGRTGQPANQRPAV